MNTEIPAIDLGAKPMVPIVEAGIESGSQTSPWNYFLSTVVVVLGVAVGAILALFIGLTTGWIQITC